MIAVASALTDSIQTKTRRVRQSQYESVAKAYAQVLPPGMSRHDVKAYLRAKGQSPFWMCCVSPQHRADSELVKIGQEKAPWYCSRLNIYIAFEFDPAITGESPTENPLDRLSDVKLYPWLEGCL
jgi:hypothetical protein